MGKGGGGGSLCLSGGKVASGEANWLEAHPTQQGHFESNGLKNAKGQRTRNSDSSLGSAGETGLGQVTFPSSGPLAFLLHSGSVLSLLCRLSLLAWFLGPELLRTGCPLLSKTLPGAAPAASSTACGSLIPKRVFSPALRASGPHSSHQPPTVSFRSLCHSTLHSTKALFAPTKIPTTHPCHESQKPQNSPSTPPS